MAEPDNIILTPDDLVFANDKDKLAKIEQSEGFRELDNDKWLYYENPILIKGGVFCFSADRAVDWDIIVIVGYKNDKFQLCYPRIRIIDGKVCMGQDKLQEEFKYTTKCICPDPVQGGDFCCHCGAFEKQLKEYADTFKKSDTNKYEIVESSLERTSGLIWLEFVESNEEHVNTLDRPIENTFCRSCKLSQQ